MVTWPTVELVVGSARLPADTVALPEVTVNPVATVKVPESDGELGIAIVTVEPDPEVVIWLEVPAMVIVVPDMEAEPVPQVNVVQPEPVCV